MHRIAALLLAGPLAARADARPDPAVSPNPGSGITSSDGGARTLGDQPKVGAATRTGPTP